MRNDATFIGIEVADEAAGDEQLAAKLEEVCPVDIFAVGGSDQPVEIVESNIDECILCAMCIKASDGAVTVHKLYSGETLAPAPS
jgi:NAD-dependent dihydropyrimidine dehydrogenase PreA subunit